MPEGALDVRELLPIDEVDDPGLQTGGQGLHDEDGVVHGHRAQELAELLGREALDDRDPNLGLDLRDHRTRRLDVLRDQDAEHHELVLGGEPPHDQGHVLGPGLVQEVGDVTPGPPADELPESRPDLLDPCNLVGHSGRL